MDEFDAMMESQLMGESFYGNPLEDECAEMECEEDYDEEAVDGAEV